VIRDVEDDQDGWVTRTPVPSGDQLGDDVADLWEWVVKHSIHCRTRLKEETITSAVSLTNCSSREDSEATRRRAVTGSDAALVEPCHITQGPWTSVGQSHPRALSDSRFPFPYRTW
jgi:hypothetical protein